MIGQLPLNEHIRRMDWEQLDRYAGDLTDDDVRAADEFGARLRQMSDGDLARWGIVSPELVASVRDLFAASWR